MNDLAKEALESRLRRCEERLAALFEHPATGVGEVDREGKIRRANERLRRILGYGAEELLGRSVTQLILPEALGRWQLAAGPVFRGKSPSATIDLPLAAIGGPVQVRLTLGPGARDRLTLFVEEISGQKRLEERYRHLASIVESSEDAVIGKSLDGTILSWNRGAERLYGYRAGEMIGRPIQDLAADEAQRREIEGILERIRRGERVEHYETARRRKDGAPIDVAVTVSPMRDEHGEIIGTSTIARDITARKRAERRLEYSNELLEKVFSSVRVLLAYMDRDFNFIKVNRAYAEADGREPAFFVGKNHFDLYPNEENERLFRRVVETGEPYQVYEKPFEYPEHPERGLSYWDWNLLPVKDESGRVVALVLSLLDVTEKSAAKRRAERSARYTRRLIEASLDPLVTIGPDGRITDVNAATEEATGRPREALIGTDFSDYFTEPEQARTGYRQVFELGFVRDYPLEIRHADGHTTPVLYNASLYNDEEGKVAGVFAAARDVTERKRAEEALRASEARLNQAQRIAHIGSWELDLGDNRLLWSDEIYRIFEIDPEKFGASYEAFLEAIHPDDRAMVDAAYTHSLKTRTPYSIDHRLLFKDGRIKHVHEQCETIYDDGRPLRSLGTVQEITDRKRVEEEIRALGRRNKLLLDSAGEGIYGLDTEGRCTFINPSAVRMLGYGSPDEIVGKPAHPLFHHSRADGTPYPEGECPVHKAFREGGVYHGADEIYWRRDGSHFPIEYVSTPINEAGRLVGAVVGFFDITERKRADQLLQLRTREQEAIAALGYRALTAAPLGALMDEAVRTVAATLEIEYCKVLKLLPGGDRLLLVAGVGWREGLVGGATVSAGLESQAGYTLMAEGPVVVRDFPRESRFSGPPLLREHGVASGMSVIIGGRERPFGVLGAHTTHHREFTKDDVNFLQSVANVIATAVERTEAEEAVRAAGAYNRRLIEASLDPLVTIGADGRITDVNAATEAVTGRSREALIGTDFSDYFTEPERARAGYRRVFEEGFVRDYPLEIRDAGGRVTPVLYNATVYRDERGEVAGLFAAARDITERKRMETELRRQHEHLEELVRQRTGQLEELNKELESFAYSVSHDLRTPLRAIDGFSRILLDEYHETVDEEGRRLLGVVRENTEKMGQLIDDILAFSRMGRLELSSATVDMQFLARSVWEDLAGLRAGRKIDFRLQPLSPVRGDPSMLKRVVENLLSNAIKFTRPVEGAWVEVGEREAPEELLYYVRDNGVGFDMRYVDKLFGVFQRLHTSEQFEGTGIGLAIVKRIVTRHGGRVWAEGAPGKGATFFFALPRRGEP